MSPLYEDRLLQIIRVAVSVLAEALGLKSIMQYERAQLLIDQMLEDLLGMRADLVHRLDYRAVLDQLTFDSQLDTDRLQLVADLTKEKGDILTEQKNVEEGQMLYLQALVFYLEVELNGCAFHLPNPADKIKNLVNILENYPLPQETSFSLFCYYDLTGKYANGAEILDRLIKDPALEASIFEEYQAFLNSLETKSDDELAEGGISRSWIEKRRRSFNMG